MGSSAATASCESPRADVTVSIDAGEPIYDRSLSSGELSKLLKPANSHTELARYDVTLGRTMPMITFTTWSDNKGYMIPEGWCVFIAQLQVIIGWTTRVNIASEIDQGSCLWMHVVAHEQRHVALDRQLFEKLQQITEQAVRAELSGVIDADLDFNADSAEKQLTEDAEFMIANAIADFMKVRDEEQAVIDTAEEYDRLTRACGPAAIRDLLSKSN